MQELFQSIRCEWAEPPARPSLGTDRLDLWRAELDKPSLTLRLLSQTLASDERARAARYHFDRDRRHFIAARGQMRRILGYYVGANASELRFSYRAHGKPLLDLAQSAQPIEFNMSHSEELALVAVTVGGAIGIDLEKVRLMSDVESIAQRFFTPRENEELGTLPRRHRLEGFFRCWTLKEAYLKATGEGLSRPPESFEVTFTQAGGPRLLSVDGKPERGDSWTLVAFSPAPGYVGAVAVEGDNRSMRFWQSTVAPGTDPSEPHFARV